MVPTYLTLVRTAAMAVLVVCCSSPRSLAQTVNDANPTSEPNIWRCSFEGSEGYSPESPARGSLIGLLGGTAAILAGESADGAQFLRFTAGETGDALVLQLVPTPLGTIERNITMAVRFPKQTPESRLVLASGLTVELRPEGDGLEITAPGRDMVRITPATAPGAWIRLTLAESPQRGNWNLLVGQQVVLSDLPLGESPAVLSDLLIFADGSLDVDDLAVESRVATVEGIVKSEDGTPDETAVTTSAAATASDSLEDDARDLAFSQAYQAACEGRVGAITSAFIPLLRVPVDEPGRRELELLQHLTMLAFALRDGGHVRPAAIVAYEALRRAERARTTPFSPDDTWGRATVEYVVGQLWEDVLIEPKEAARAFRRASEIDVQHAAALHAAERIEKVETDADATVVTGGVR